MDERNAEGFRWIVLPEAQRWIDQAAEQLPLSPSMIAKLRQALSRAQVDEVVTQARLRERARKKFTAADRMVFTEKGLEQATDERIAAYKASGFPCGVLADLCCGIGGDLIALAQQRQVLAADRDPRCAVFAEANCRALGCSNFEVRAEDVGNLALDDFAAWHIDPDRRPLGQRTTHTAFCEPSAEKIDRWLKTNPHAGIKLAPAARFPDAWAEQAELEWIGIHRECRQLFARFGQLARHPGRHVATLLDAEGHPAAQVVGTIEPVSVASAIGGYLFEPHACVIAAGLVGALGRQHALSAVAADVAYLTGDAAVPSAAMSAFERIATMPFDLRRVKAELRNRQWGQLEIKRRMIPEGMHGLKPETLRKRLSVDGDRAGVLFLFPRQGQVVATLAQRVV